MKKILLVFLLATSSLFGQTAENTCELVYKINTLLQQEHFKPKKVDDSLSVYVFDNFMDELDFNRNIFTKKEYLKLRKHRLKLDDYILKNNCSFMTEFISVYRMALIRKKNVLEKIQNDPFDYTKNDSIRFSKTNFPFDLVAKNLEYVWKKRIKYSILEDISKLSTNLDSLTDNFSALEKLAKAKLFDANLCQVNSILETKNQIEVDLQNSFLNLFCTYFDPHTNYLSLAAKSNFMSGLSTSTLSLGLIFQLNEKEQIIIAEIVPAGPAAKTNRFEKDDILLEISNTRGTSYIVSCASLDKVAELIFSDTNPTLELTIQKKSGAVINVVLKKQFMKATDNAVYSFIAEKETKIGYINIPSFYSNFDNNSIQGCTDDVAKEIIKLQKENIKGLVIDLQNNGGGSIEEAIRLAGMFIDQGPFSILVNNKDDQIILQNEYEGSLYNGPIVLLMNGHSASASELFAAAIQDYSRGLIIGSTSLGKATMQSIASLNTAKEESFVKVTIEKFYRITGESNQIKGVIPDVALPALFDSIIPREKSYATAFKNESIIPKIRFKPMQNNHFSQLITLSNTRVKNSAVFNKIRMANEEINALYNNSKKPTRVAFTDVFADVHEKDSLWNQFKKIGDRESNFTLSNTAEDLEKIKKDAFLQDINTYKIQNLKNSPYLEEAIAILNDYKNLVKK